ncbi:MAG: ferrochelatase [Holophaga sp.]|nr:ferrochelatase [Holophaga sp.]
MNSIQPDTAIVLMNLGGPLRLVDIRPFLLNLFNDRDIIRLGPAFLQPLIARLIVRSRLKAVQGRYGAIGGGSPILRETAAQASALRKGLREAGRQEPVQIVFRYTSPRAKGALRSLALRGITKILPVTLYPHDCRATTGSSLVELEREASAQGIKVLPGVMHYATDSDYLACMEATLRATLAQTPGATVIFSAHSLPVKQIESGDPYEAEIHRTIDALKDRLGEVPGGYRLGYQSKVGPIKWLTPALEEVLKESVGKDVVIVPVSFVGEHIETLHELDIEYRELAEKLGVKRYLRVPAPGTHPDFVRCLVRQTLAALARSEA